MVMRYPNHIFVEIPSSHQTQACKAIQRMLQQAQQQQEAALGLPGGRERAPWDLYNGGNLPIYLTAGR